MGDKKKTEEGKGKRHAPTETTKAVRHISEFVSVMFTSVISQSCSHSEGAKQKGKVFQQLERQNNFEKGPVHVNYKQLKKQGV